MADAFVECERQHRFDDNSLEEILKEYETDLKNFKDPFYEDLDVNEKYIANDWEEGIEVVSADKEIAKKIAYKLMAREGGDFEFQK